MFSRYSDLFCCCKPPWYILWMYISYIFKEIKYADMFTLCCIWTLLEVESYWILLWTCGSHLKSKKWLQAGREKLVKIAPSPFNKWEHPRRIIPFTGSQNPTIVSELKLNWIFSSLVGSIYDNFTYSPSLGSPTGE